MSYGIGAYYKHRCGTITVRPFAAGGPQRLGIAALIFASLVLQDAFTWSVSLPLIVIDGVLGYVGITQGRLRRHYLWIAR